MDETETIRMELDGNDCTFTRYKGAEHAHMATLNGESIEPKVLFAMMSDVLKRGEGKPSALD